MKAKIALLAIIAVLTVLIFSAVYSRKISLQAPTNEEVKKRLFGLRLSRGKQRRTVCEQTRTGVRAKANTACPAGLEEAGA